MIYFLHAQQGFVATEALIVVGLLVIALVLTAILSVEFHELKKRRRTRALAKIRERELTLRNRRDAA